MSEPKLSRRRRFIERVRHAKHPVTGWRRWAVIMGQATAGFVVVFAALNLILSLSTFRGDQPLDRTVQELRGLWFSPVEGRPMASDAFQAAYGAELGPDPDTRAIHDYLEQEAADGVFLLDHIMIERIRGLNGRVDARAIPSGIYVGAHALGPDGPPFVSVTKYLAHYLLFPRHAYILVVPEDGEAISFSASQNAKFNVHRKPDRLAAVIAPFNPDAYDFPSSGQALHEMTLVTRDPTQIAGAVPVLRRAQARLAERDLRYGLLAPNSNTVIGCLLQEAGAITQERRGSILLALRAPGFGAACD